MTRLAFLLFLAFPAGLHGQASIPAGTVLPIRLERSLSSESSKPGQEIHGRIMQDVPLPGGTKIRAGSRVIGKVRDARAAASGGGGRLTIIFDKVSYSKGSVAVITNLRAIASLLEVDEAQIQEYGGDRGTPSSAFTTRQIGGEMVYRGGGHVMDGATIVGEPAPNGVLVRARAAEGKRCRGAVAGNDAPQAMWIFSSDACGAYGFGDLRIAHAGRTDPVGEIVLKGETGELHVRSGTGMLLRVNGSSK